jgi:hypothetical protein
MLKLRHSATVVVPQRLRSEQAPNTDYRNDARAASAPDRPATEKQTSCGVPESTNEDPLDEEAYQLAAGMNLLNPYQAGSTTSRDDSAYDDTPSACPMGPLRATRAGVARNIRTRSLRPT